MAPLRKKSLRSDTRNPGGAPFRGGGKNDDLNDILEEVSSSRRRSPIRADAALSEREISKLPTDAQEIARKMTSLALDLKDAKSLLLEHANGVKRGFEIGDVLGHATKLVESCSTEYDGATQERLKECPPGDTHYCIDTGVAYIKRGKDGKATDIGQCIVPSKTFERIDAKRGDEITTSVDSLKRQHNSILSLYTNLSSLLKDTSQAACETLTTRGACLSPYGAQRCVFEGQRNDDGDAEQRDPRELAKEMALSGKMKYPTLSKDDDEANYMHKDKEFYPQPSDVGKCKSAMGHSYKVHEAAGVELKRLKSHVTRVENRLNGGEMKKFSSNRDSGIGNTPSMAGQRRVYEGLVAQKRKIARRISELEGQLLNNRNELLENAYKYALAQRMDATCQVRLSKTDTLDKCAVGMSPPEISPDDNTRRYSGCGTWDSQKGRYLSTVDLEKIENRAAIAGGRFQCRSVPAQNITWRPALNERLEQRGIVSIGSNMDATNISYESNNALAPLQHALESQPINLLLQLAMTIDKIDWETEQAQFRETLKASDKISLARRYDSGDDTSEIDELMRRGDMSDDEIKRELEATKGLRGVDAAGPADYQQAADDFKKKFGGGESDEFAQPGGGGGGGGDDESHLGGGNYVYKIGRDRTQRDFQMRMYTEAKAGSMDGDPAMRSVNAARIMLKSLSDSTITAVQEHLQDNPYSDTFKAEFINAVDQIASLLRPSSADVFLATVRRISQSTGIPVTDSGGVELLNELKELKKRGGTFGPYGAVDVVQRIFVPGEKLIIRTKQDGENVEWHSFVVHTNKTPNDSASSSTVGSFGSPMFVLVDVNREQETSLRSQLSKVVGDSAQSAGTFGYAKSNWTNHGHMIVPAPMFTQAFNATTGGRYNSLWGGADAPEFVKYGSTGMEVDLPVVEVNHKTMQNKTESPIGNDAFTRAVEKFRQAKKIGGDVDVWNKAVMGGIHKDILKIIGIFYDYDSGDPTTRFPPIGGRTSIGARVAGVFNTISAAARMANTESFANSMFDLITDEVDIDVGDPQNVGWSALAQVNLIIPLLNYLGVGNTAVLPATRAALVAASAGRVSRPAVARSRNAAPGADHTSSDPTRAVIREVITDHEYYRLDASRVLEKIVDDTGVKDVNKEGMSLFYKQKAFPFINKDDHALKFGAKPIETASPPPQSFQEITGKILDIVKVWKKSYMDNVGTFSSSDDEFTRSLQNSVEDLIGKLELLYLSVKEMNMTATVGIFPDFDMGFLTKAQTPFAVQHPEIIRQMNDIFIVRSQSLFESFTKTNVAYDALGWANFRLHGNKGSGGFRGFLFGSRPNQAVLSDIGIILSELSGITQGRVSTTALFTLPTTLPAVRNLSDSVLLRLVTIKKITTLLDGLRNAAAPATLGVEAKLLMSFYTIGALYEHSVEKLTKAVEGADTATLLVKVFIGDAGDDVIQSAGVLNALWDHAVNRSDATNEIGLLKVGIVASLKKYIPTPDKVDPVAAVSMDNVEADTLIKKGLQYLNYLTMSVFAVGVMNFCLNVQLSLIPVNTNANNDSKAIFKEHVAKAFFQAYEVVKADIGTRPTVAAAPAGDVAAKVKIIFDTLIAGPAIMSFNNDQRLESYFNGIVQQHTSLTRGDIPDDFRYIAPPSADEFDDGGRRVTFADDLEADELVRGGTSIRLATQEERDEFDEFSLSGGGHAYSDMSDQEIMTLSAEELLTAYEKDEMDDDGGPGFDDLSGDGVNGDDGIEGGAFDFSIPFNRRGSGAGLDNTGRPGKNRFFSNNHGRCNTATDKNTQRCFVEIPGANPVSHAEMIMHSFRCAFMLLTDYMIRVKNTKTVGNKLVGCNSDDFENPHFRNHILAEFAFLTDPHYIWRPGQNENIPAKFNSYDTSKLSTPLHIKNHLVSTYWGDETKSVAVDNVGLSDDPQDGFANKPFLFKQMYSNFISAGVHSSVTNVFLQHFNAGTTANGWHIEKNQMTPANLATAMNDFGVVGTSNLETVMNQATTKLNGLTDPVGNTSNFIHDTLGNFVVKNPNTYFKRDNQGTISYTSANDDVYIDVPLNQHFSGRFVPEKAKGLWKTPDQPRDDVYANIQQSMWKMNVYDAPFDGSEWKLNKVFEDFDPAAWSVPWNKILLPRSTAAGGFQIVPNTLTFDPAIRKHIAPNNSTFAPNHPNSIGYGGVRKGDSNSAWMLSPVYVMLMVLERARKSVIDPVCAGGGAGTTFGGGYNEFIGGGYNDDMGDVDLEGGGSTGLLEGGGSVAKAKSRAVSIPAYDDSDEARGAPENDEYKTALHRLSSADDTDLNMIDDVRNALGRLDSHEDESASRSASMEERDSVTDDDIDIDSAMDERDSAMDDDLDSAMYERDSALDDEEDSLDEADDAVDEEDEAWPDEEDDAVDEADDAVDEEDEAWQDELNNLIIQLKSKSDERKDGAVDLKTPTSRDEYSHGDSGNTHYEDFGMPEFDEARIEDSRLESIKYKIPSADTVSIDSISDWKRA